jgi:hypothetical protein
VFFVVAGVSNILVELLNGSTVLATTLTNATGYYLFCNLYPSPTVGYQVRFTLPPNYVFTACRAAGMQSEEEGNKIESNSH